MPPAIVAPLRFRQYRITTEIIQATLTKKDFPRDDIIIFAFLYNIVGTHNVHRYRLNLWCRHPWLGMLIREIRKPM